MNTSSQHGPSRPAVGPLLSDIENILALILECGNDAPKISSSLVPALGNFLKVYHQNANQLLSMPVQAIHGQVDPLTMLDPNTHTVGILFILAARSSSISNHQDASAFLPILDTFVQSFDGQQASLAPDQLTLLSNNISNIGQVLSNPAFSLNTLQTIFQKSIQNPCNLTTLHPILAKQYLKSGQYQAAVENLLKYDIIDTDPNVTPLHYNDSVEYFYAAGSIYLKLERYIDAVDCFQTCIAIPTKGFISLTQLNAIKKLVLSNLLAYGKVITPPRYVSNANKPLIPKLAQVYLDFANAYEKRRPDTGNELRRIFEEHRERFIKDGNAELVELLLQEHVERRIQRLADIYSTLSLANIAELVGITGPDAQAKVGGYVEKLIAKGWIYAKMVTATSELAVSNEPSIQGDDETLVIVCFSTTSSENYDNVETIARLNKEIKRAQYWNDLLLEREKEISRSEAFIHKLIKSNKEKRWNMAHLEEDFEDESYDE